MYGPKLPEMAAALAKEKIESGALDLILGKLKNED